MEKTPLLMSDFSELKREREVDRWLPTKWLWSCLRS